MTFSTLRDLDLYIFSFLITLIVGFKSFTVPKEMSAQIKIFFSLTVQIGLILLLDFFTLAFDGAQGLAFRQLLYVSICLGFIMQVHICVLWFRYIRVITMPDYKQSRGLRYFENFCVVAFVLFTLISCFTGWLFYIDSYNRYQRGPLFFVVVVLSFIFLFAGYVYVFIIHKNLEKRLLSTLILYSLPLLFGGIIQTLFIQSNVLWPSMTLSLLIMYIGIQNDLLFLDDLTGLPNRKRFSWILSRRISSARKERAFGLMLIDLDKMRLINERFGYTEGDLALKLFARWLLFVFKERGLVFRFSGDSFAVIVSLNSYDELIQIRNEVYAKLDVWNKSLGKKWTIAINIGAAPYIPEDNLDFDSFISSVDKLLRVSRLVPDERRKNFSR